MVCTDGVRDGGKVFTICAHELLLFFHIIMEKEIALSQCTLLTIHDQCAFRADICLEISKFQHWVKVMSSGKGSTGTHTV